VVKIWFYQFAFFRRVGKVYRQNFPYRVIPQREFIVPRKRQIFRPPLDKNKSIAQNPL
jgi:hypothetical protein